MNKKCSKLYILNRFRALTVIAAVIGLAAIAASFYPGLSGFRDFMNGIVPMLLIAAGLIMITVPQQVRKKYSRLLPAFCIPAESREAPCSNFYLYREPEPGFPVPPAEELKPLASTIPSVSSKLTRADRLSAVKVRWGIGRNNSKVDPGLYKIGNPGSQSDVFVSANYKLSFDTLRKNLDSFDAWILVIDTKGVNVWCAAGKGTFGTNNLVNSIRNSSLSGIVKHRKIIVPQLGATGVAAHKVKEQTGFRVIFGPVRAVDIGRFVAAGYKAMPEMRRVTFGFRERAKLIPVDLMYGKYKLLMILTAFFVLAGLDPKGFLFTKMYETGLFPVMNVTVAYLAGIVIAPLLLPVIPFRAFALKGAFWGLAATLVLNFFFRAPVAETIALGLVNVSIASFMTMNFTGSSTYTSLSGVKREMKVAVPFQVTFAVSGLILFIISKFI